MEIGFGQLRLNPISLFDMTLDEFELAVSGFQKMSEIRERGDWERTRWLATILLQPHMKKGKELKPTDLAQFPWEQKQKKTNMVNGEKLLEQLMK